MKPHKRARGRGVRRNGRSRKDGGFVKLDHGMLDSDAWNALSPHAVKLLVAIWRRHDGRNNGTMPFSVREACALLRCGPHRASACFRELTDKGFLHLSRESGFSLKTREAREWALTAERVGDDPPTRAFRQWSPPPAIWTTVAERASDGCSVSNREHRGVTSNQLHGCSLGNRERPDGTGNGCPPSNTYNLPAQGDSGARRSLIGMGVFFVRHGVVPDTALLMLTLLAGAARIGSGGPR